MEHLIAKTLVKFGDFPTQSQSCVWHQACVSEQRSQLPHMDALLQRWITRGVRTAYHLVSSFTTAYPMGAAQVGKLQRLWRISLRSSLLNLWHQHYMFALAAWLVVPQQQVREVIYLSPSEQPYQIMAHRWHQLQRSLGLSRRKRTAQIALAYWELTRKRPKVIGSLLSNLLESVPVRSHRRAMMFAVKCLQPAVGQHKVPEYLQGLHICLKGKINRSGSARKQKLVWQYGSIKRAMVKQMVYSTTTQVKTTAGALGLNLLASYKDEWNTPYVFP